VFFLGSPVIALVVLPFVALVSGERAKDRATHVLHLGMKAIMRTARSVGIVELDLPPPPASIDLGKPYVMISNHPTFIDMIVILGTFPRLTCVTNGRWWKHWALGRLLRATHYIAGPGSGIEGEDETSTVDKIVAQLGHGHPVLIFPEGQRSLPDRLRRFRRGASEAATRAEVPLVPLYLSCDPPYLTKTIPITRPPAVPPTYRFEWLTPQLPGQRDDDPRALQKTVEAEYDARFQSRRALPSSTG
jgi:1-acyl-sn-glycerol-3-phosphate acyltransferase